MKGMGPAAQTLAAMRRLAAKNGETFASIRVIADIACLPQRTVKRHLRSLVHFQWLECQGRRGRRTPTYVVPMRLINRTGSQKFALLPRWAARMLNTWAERAVFACIISRDVLCTDVLDDEVEDGGECFGRRVYTISVLEKDTGLSRPAIIEAKRKLVDRGLVTIDRAVNYRNELGRLRAIGDTLYLNLDFLVPVELLDPPVQSHRPPVQQRKSNGYNTVNRSKKAAPTRLESGPCSREEVAREEVKKRPAQLNEHPNETPKRSLIRTADVAAEAPPAVLVNGESSILKSKKAFADVDIEQRRNNIEDALRAAIASETLEAG